MPPRSRPRARRWGVDKGYRDYRGRWHAAPEETVRAVLAQLAGDEERPGPPEAPVRVVTVGPSGEHARRRLWDGPAELHTEDGGVVRVEGGAGLPPDLPLGYHELVRPDDGARTRLIVAPDRCPLPPDLFTWGWVVQLYAARSAASWGMGDLGDLGRLGRWSADELGAGFLAVNPLHAPLLTLPQEPSPYFPSSRRWRNPLYLRVEDVAGAADAAGTGDLARLAAAGRALNADRRIDRDEVFRLKTEALGHLWARFRAAGGDPDFDHWRTGAGEEGGLADYATFCALAEHHRGRPWWQWPEEHRRPDAPGVARFRHQHEDRVTFHGWVQWLLDRQLAEASTALPVVHDLAVGIDPAGADAWCWQDVIATPFTVGVPPDEFNARGQDWSLAPFDPWRLRAEGYEPFAQTVRAVLRHAGGLRVDHVMGLFRLFWVPHEGGPDAGTYVRYPAADLLGVLALESARAGAFVVGEDLGTVERRVRKELRRRGVLSCRLLWFERTPPARYPRQALATVATHDLPTVAGLWTGTDVEAQHALDLAPNEDGATALRARLAKRLGLPLDAPPAQVVPAAYAWLARAPCALLAATLDDALEVAERPNMPGTTKGWPNWSLALPLPLDEIVDDPRPAALAAVLRRDGRSPDEASSG